MQIGAHHGNNMNTYEQYDNNNMANSHPSQLRDSPGYNSQTNKKYTAIQRKKPPIHRNSRVQNPKNMDLYNPSSGINDLPQSMLPTIGSQSELSNPISISAAPR